MVEFITKNGRKIPINNTHKKKKSNKPTLIIRTSKPGRLGEGFFQKSEAEQHRILAKDAEKYGERSTMGTMAAKQTWFKNKNPEIAREAKQNRHWVAENFEGKKRI